mmetsp:Transcript_28396/g.69194  ORF Transcript_28396/g.69194 Transcript_28396/m.69194 type:complete len:230 (+) Transcript_28396:1398-2087(+)
MHLEVPSCFFEQRELLIVICLCFGPRQVSSRRDEGPEVQIELRLRQSPVYVRDALDDEAPSTDDDVVLVHETKHAQCHEECEEVLEGEALCHCDRHVCELLGAFGEGHARGARAPALLFVHVIVVVAVGSRWASSPPPCPDTNRLGLHHWRSGKHNFVFVSPPSVRAVGGGRGGGGPGSTLAFVFRRAISERARERERERERERGRGERRERREKGVDGRHALSCYCGC